MTVVPSVAERNSIPTGGKDIDFEAKLIDIEAWAFEYGLKVTAFAQCEQQSRVTFEAVTDHPF